MTHFHLSDSLVNILNHVKMLPVYVGQAAIFLFGEPCPDCLLLLRVSNLTVLGDKVTYGEDVTLVEGTLERYPTNFTNMSLAELRGSSRELDLKLSVITDRQVITSSKTIS